MKPAEFRTIDNGSRHRDWLIQLQMRLESVYPWRCVAVRVDDTSGRVHVTPAFSHQLSPLAYAVTRIDHDDWK